MSLFVNAKVSHLVEKRQYHVFEIQFLPPIRQIRPDLKSFNKKSKRIDSETFKAI